MVSIFSSDKPATVVKPSGKSKAGAGLTYCAAVGNIKLARIAPGGARLRGHPTQFARLAMVEQNRAGRHLSM
jgi:hypothetical protein